MDLYYRFKDRFGTAGVLIGVIALVMALVTGAYAAGGGLSGKQKKEVEKIAKKYAGKPGANGSNGAPGATGPQGPAGANGTNGAPGEPGKGIVAEEVKTGVAGECNKLGGTSFHEEGSATKQFACNGQTGFTETLPKGKTETGAWSMFDTAAGEYTSASGSFPIPLAASLDANHVHFVMANGKEWVLGSSEVVEEVTPTACGTPLGTASNPKASPGNLCVYGEEEIGFKPTTVSSGEVANPSICNLGSTGNFCSLTAGHRAGWGAGPTGFGLTAELAPGGFVLAAGTWAVTAP